MRRQNHLYQASVRRYAVVSMASDLSYMNLSLDRYNPNETPRFRGAIIAPIWKKEASAKRLLLTPAVVD